MIGKLLYKIFKKQFLKYYFYEQSGKVGFEKMKCLFVDSDAKSYYAPENDFDMPLERVRGIERCVRKIIAGLSENEYKRIREAMKKALIEKRPNIPMIGHLLIEMDRREDMLLHPEIMFDLVAHKYIREDENPTVIDKTIHAQKIEQFKKDSVDGLQDFFYKAGLATYMPYLTKLDSEWEEYWRTSKAEVEALKEQLTQYTLEES